jgi:hypothetical protein
MLATAPSIAFRDGMTRGFQTNKRLVMSGNTFRSCGLSRFYATRVTTEAENTTIILGLVYAVFMSA